MDMNAEKELAIKEYALRENMEYHAPYVPEFDFYFAVKSGDVDRVEELCAVPFTEKGGFGRLCDDSLQNMKYHFAITAAMIARYCIEAGMEHETAYSLSDIYIRSCDRCVKDSELSGLHKNMSLDYTRRMKALRKQKVYSKQAVMCINYIHQNLHKKLRAEDIADEINLSVSYLSRLFKKETGMTITDYIISKKITAAKNMLKFSPYSISDISQTLAFSSQSHFTETFRKYEGMTPKKYRELCSFNTEIAKDKE